MKPEPNKSAVPERRRIKELEAMVADVIQETPDTTTLVLFTGNERLDYKPGNFLTIDPHQFDGLERFTAFLEDLKGKKVAIGSLGGTNMAAARASIKALGLDADKDVTYIVIGAASIRIAAMETGSVQASMMPAPWNVRMKQKGFKEMMFAGDVISDPLNGIVTSKEKLDKNPEQVKKVLRGFLRALQAVRTEKKDVSEFMAVKFNLDVKAAEDVYVTLIQTLTEDGTVSDQLLQEQLEQLKKEGALKKDVTIGEIVDYRLVHELGRELERR